MMQCQLYSFIYLVLQTYSGKEALGNKYKNQMMYFVEKNVKYVKY